MYPLGKQFEVNYTKAKSDAKAIVQGANYRISIISERVIRLEYSQAGQFVDRPTQLIRKRNIGLADFSVRQDANIVEVTTKYLALNYIKGQPFVGNKVDPMKNLKITLLSRDRDRNKDWYYGHPEARNMLGNLVGVDVNIPKNLQKGLYSLDGFATIDDSLSKIIMEDGTLAEPPKDHIDLYVFMYDRDFKQALFDYFKMTGPPALPPRYALGNWWSRNIQYDDKAIHELIRNFERKKIPLAVMLFDNDWHIRNVGQFRDLKNGYTFNTALIKNPKGMIDEFHNRGIRVGLIVNPTEGIYPHEAFYKFMYDRDFKQALFDYFKMTGPPALPPRYALGNWWSRNIQYDDKAIHELIRNFERKKIPLAVMLFDNDWHIRNVGQFRDLKNGYTFNTALIKNPKGMIDEFHNRGIRVGLIVNPTEGIYPHEAFYKQASEYLGVTNGAVIQFDPLNPKLLDVLFKVFLHPLESVGVDFFWNDSTGGNDVTRLWALDHYMYLDSGRNNNKRGMILGRGSVIAPHRYPIIYGGSSSISWENLKNLPFLYLNAANIGVSWWSHDVAGNHGGIEEGELYVRYLQLSTFSPIFRFHGARGPYYKKEPWVWDAQTANIAADYMRLRHRFIPYLYTEAYNYTRAGTPLIQPFYYNYMWVYDDTLYRNQYYFGSQLLVCPILDKADKTMMRTVHRFFIPDGTWYDFVTGKKFPGNKKYISFFKEEDYPVFAHAGSIIPLSNRSDYQNVGLPTDLEIQIFPGVSNTYTLYEDDGITSLYKEGYYLKTSIDYNYLRNNYTVIIRSIEGKSGIAPEKRNYKMVFRNTKEAENVTIFFNADKVQSENYVDGNDFIVEIKDIPTIGQLTINCKGKDIEIDAARLINDDVNSILMDLQIETYTKEKIAAIMFSNEANSKKRIAIRKLKKAGLSKDYVNLFLRLLEYINEV